jgi:hypothetical protein
MEMKEIQEGASINYTDSINDSINLEDDIDIDILNYESNFSTSNTLNAINLKKQSNGDIENDGNFTKVEILGLDESDTSEQFSANNKNKQLLKKHIFAVCLTLGWIIFYLISLLGCPTSENKYKCDEPMNRFRMINRIYYLLASVFLFFSINILVLFKKIDKKYFYISLTIFVYLVYVYDTGDDNLYHGFFNRKFFYLFYLIYSIIFTFCFLLYKSLITRPIITLILISYLIYYSYFKILRPTINQSCDNWNKGFKNSTIIDDAYCKIDKPEVCHLKIFNGVFDFSKLFGLDCKYYKNDKEYFLLKEWTNKSESKIFGYPRTEKMKLFPDSTLYYLQNNIFKSIIDMHDKSIGDEIKNQTEVIIDFTNSTNDFYPQVNITLKKNETLIKERFIKFNSSNSLFKNVLYIYIDSLSKNHFKRKLPKVYEFFEENYLNSTSKFSSYQFLKYHALLYYTYPNVVPSSFGVKHDKPGGKYFIYNAKEAGYITGQAYDACSKDIFDLYEYYEQIYDFPTFDHEFFGLYCDPNYAEPNLRRQENYYLNMNYQPLIGAYSIKRRCLYGKDAAEYQIEYTKQFFDTYKDQAKIFRLSFIDAHEFSQEVIKYVDDPIYNMLNYLKIKGHLDDTLVILQSDHGTSIKGTYSIWEPRDYYNEIFLPCLFYMIPKNVTGFEDLDDSLKYNENIMTTPFDFYASLINVFERNSTVQNYGISLFSNYVDKTKRDCKTFDIEDKYCMCKARI